MKYKTIAISREFGSGGRTIGKNVAEKLGIPGTVKVCAGAGDNAAAAVGTGVVGEGGCNISLGTSGSTVPMQS